MSQEGPAQHGVHLELQQRQENNSVLPDAREEEHLTIIGVWPVAFLNAHVPLIKKCSPYFTLAIQCAHSAAPQVMVRHTC